MEPNPYLAPPKGQDVAANRPAWPWMFKLGCLTMVVGVLAVVGAHLWSPPRYAYVFIASTEKIVWLGLVLVFSGGVCWAISRRRGMSKEK